MWAWRALAGKPNVSAAPLSSSMSGYGGDAAMADMRAAEQRRLRRRRRRAHAVVLSTGLASQRRHRRRRRRRAHAVVADAGLAAQRRHRRRRRRRAHAKRVTRTGATKKVRVVGKHPRTGKKIYRGKDGGRYTRGLHGNKTYL